MKTPLTRPGQLSPRRKAIYYLGMAMSAIGFLSFFSTFLTFAMHFGDFDHFEANARSDFFRAFGGMFLIIAGGVVMTVGVRGAAGSGLTLDPEQAARDLEPWARTSGRLTDAAFSEMHAVRETIGGLRGEPAAPDVKVRCQACEALNDEEDRFCGQCGAKL